MQKGSIWFYIQNHLEPVCFHLSICNLPVLFNGIVYIHISILYLLKTINLSVY